MPTATHTTATKALPHTQRSPVRVQEGQEQDREGKEQEGREV